MKKSVLNTALSTAFIVALGFGISACSGDKEGESHEVLAKDKVDEAAELARKNAPEAEKLDFPETAPMPAAETDATADTEAGTETATAQDGTVATDASAASVAPATASADTEVASTVTEMAGTDATANAPASN